MKKIEAVMRPGRLEAVKQALGRIGVEGMTVSNVIDYGLPNGRRVICRGTAFVKLLPKVKVEVVVPDAFVDQVVEMMSRAVPSGELEDGRVFIYPVETTARIGTGEKEAAKSVTGNGA